TPTTPAPLYPLSLHDALPISRPPRSTASTAGAPLLRPCTPAIEVPANEYWNPTSPTSRLSLAQDNRAYDDVRSTTTLEVANLHAPFPSRTARPNGCAAAVPHTRRTERGRHHAGRSDGGAAVREPGGQLGAGIRSGRDPGAGEIRVGPSGRPRAGARPVSGSSHAIDRADARGIPGAPQRGLVALSRSHRHQSARRAGGRSDCRHLPRRHRPPPGGGRAARGVSDRGGSVEHLLAGRALFVHSPDPRRSDASAEPLY